MKLWIVETSPNYALDVDRNLYANDGDGTWYANGAQLEADNPLVPPELGDDLRVWASQEEFLAADAARLRSPERDYGVLWREGGSSWVTQRVSYVFTTGELYATPNAGSWVGWVELLAVFTAEDCSECEGAGAAQDPLDAYCRGCGGTGKSTDAVEQALEGWAEICGTPGSLEWLRERVTAFGAAA